MGYHSAYIDTSGNLYTFGGNWNGQLGTPYGYDDFDVSTPQLIDTNVKFVGGGDSHTFYIKNDGTLYGMGQANDGQLGDGQWDDVITPKVIDTGVTYAVGGNEHSFYIKTNKELYGMGYNWMFQLGGMGYPTTLYYTDATGWTKEGVTQFIYTGTDYTSTIYWSDAIYAEGKFIAGGGEGFTRIIYSNDGKTWVTGSIDNIDAGIRGIAYNGTNKYVAVSGVSDGYNDGRPEVFTSTDGINWITGSLNNTEWRELGGVRYLNGKFIAGGDERIVTSTDGDNWTEQTQSFYAYTHKFAYGAGKYVAAVGWGDWDSSNRAVFNQTFDSRSADFVYSGDGHSMILKDGTLYGCGYNGDGQLGIGSTVNMVGFVPITSNVRNVAPGQYFTSFVKNDSTLWAMGANYNRQLGDGTFLQRNSPVQIDTNVSRSFAGPGANNNMFYVKNDGTLWGVGYNSNGQLGGGDLLGGYVTESIQIDTNVVQASVGGDHVVYLKSDGTLWGRGLNAQGQLGAGAENNLTSSYQITSSVAYCTAGAYQSFFITTGGDLYGMGQNNYGQLGVGDYFNKNTPTFITSSVSQVSATFYYTSFVTTGGDLYSMGYNGWAQWGIGYGTNDSDVPVFCTSSIDMVSCGQSFTYIIANDGNVYSAGDDGNGQLGTYKKVYKGMYSSDAVTWYSSSMTECWYNDVAYGNGRFVATGDNYNIIASSTDGMNWTSSIISTSSYLAPNRVIFDGTKFVCIAWYGDNNQNLYTSTDGVNWTISSTGDNQTWGSLAYGDGKYVALSNWWNSEINPKYKLTIG
jgi:alpha-tubulin suppressor-like RCC1 family protein